MRWLNGALADRRGVLWQGRVPWGSLNRFSLVWQSLHEVLTKDMSIFHYSKLIISKISQFHFGRIAPPRQLRPLGRSISELEVLIWHMARLGRKVDEAHSSWRNVHSAAALHRLSYKLYDLWTFFVGKVNSVQKRGKNYFQNEKAVTMLQPM